VAVCLSFPNWFCTHVHASSFFFPAPSFVFSPRVTHWLARADSSLTASPSQYNFFWGLISLAPGLSREHFQSLLLKSVPFISSPPSVFYTSLLSLICFWIGSRTKEFKHLLEILSLLPSYISPFLFVGPSFSYPLRLSSSEVSPYFFRPSRQDYATMLVNPTAPLPPVDPSSLSCSMVYHVLLFPKLDARNLLRYLFRPPLRAIDKPRPTRPLSSPNFLAAFSLTCPRLHLPCRPISAAIPRPLSNRFPRFVLMIRFFGTR